MMTIQTDIYIPLDVARTITGTASGYQSFTVVAANGVDVTSFVNTVGDFFASYYTYNDSWTVSASSISNLVESMTEMLNTVSLGISAIAAISLLVGGIGIMNIMLVSVTERTREIGIRKSLGAKQKDIRGQFVIEAGTTSAVGGVLGIVFGLLLARAATIAVGAIMSSSMNGITFSAVPTLSDIAVSFGVSVGIGVLFGYLPANKAAKLNPIDALRYD